MHPSPGPSPAGRRGAGRPAAVLLALASLTACSGHDTTVPAPASNTTATAAATAPAAGDSALTEATLTAGPDATTEQLQQSATQLQARAHDMGLAGLKTRIDGSTISVTAPGNVRDKIAALARPGLLRLRPVLALAPCVKGLPAPGSPAAGVAFKDALRAPATEPTATGTVPAPAAPGDLSAALTQGAVPPEFAAQWARLDCSNPGSRLDYQHAATAPAIACSTDADRDTWYKFLLGPVGVDGADITDAKAAFDDQQGAGWQVQLSFDAAGAKAFADVTGRLATQPDPTNQFAIVVDGSVLSHPYVRSAIPGGSAVISGSFTREQAEQLASALTHRFPVELKVSDVTTVPSGGTTP
ncbi:hypothetical protein ACFV1W_23055 [Kitasatospora sp. NPDC059648]|uniref:SecDF P1 head subdomain-containing protein n=1 Tax=Kitasatospora sp. NPDC059648 TaxID=3346894 RepID=UPI00368F11CA